MTNYTTKVAEPTAHITVKKQRVKQNGKNVYLDNNTEFELELYNPTDTKLKATIEFDGNLISTSGIVLRPGERIFLDRYLDVDRKFLYETYEVKDTEQNREAIDNNGLVKVRFYQKQSWQNPSIFSGSNAYFTRNWGLNNSGYVNGNGVTFTTTGMNLVSEVSNSYKANDTVETGRVEMGDKSNQVFQSEYDMYYAWSSWETSWKILPKSQELKTSKDLIQKCNRCNTKLKSNWKFCPECGTQMVRTKTEIHYTMDNQVSIGTKLYTMVTYRDTLDNFLKRNENKLIYIQTDSLTSDSLRAIVID
jgi:hypothetical protein